MSNGHVGLLMLALVVVAIMLGFPTAFTLMGLGIVFGYIAFFDPTRAFYDNRVFDLMVQRTYGAMTNDDATFQQLLMSYAEYVIRTGDRDGDGRLDEAEYATILWCYGIADADARAAFRHLVTDGSGYLTNAAMEIVFAEFFRSDDPAAPGNWMIGPL